MHATQLDYQLPHAENLICCLAGDPMSVVVTGCFENGIYLVVDRLCSSALSTRPGRKVPKAYGCLHYN